MRWAQFWFIISIIRICYGTLNRCHEECTAPLDLRLVGPTRPYFPEDPLGNPLSLTRPHPYAIAPTKINVTEVEFNLTSNVLYHHEFYDAVEISERDHNILLDIWRDFLFERYQSGRVVLISESLSNDKSEHNEQLLEVVASFDFQIQFS